MSYYDDYDDDKDEEPDVTWEDIEREYCQDEEDGDGNGYLAGRYDD